MDSSMRRGPQVVRVHTELNQAITTLDTVVNPFSMRDVEVQPPTPSKTSSTLYRHNNGLAK
jgi:hypothetical protein